MSRTGDRSGHEWADQVSDRAVDRAAPVRPPIVPEPVTARRSGPEASEPTDETGQMPKVTPVVDELAHIQWAEGAQVRPASEPIAAQPGLTADAVGRSAWADGLQSIGTDDPEGWERLSWQDLDGAGGSGASPVKDPAPFVRVLREWGPVLVAAVAIALFTRLVLVQAYHIPSLSMAPTLEEGDRVIVNRLSYRFGEIERGQVVVFKKPPNQPSDANDLIKRVIALPGETVQFRDGEVYIDGQLVVEPYLAQPSSTRPRSLAIPGCAQEERASDVCTVPSGYVFVMGDNRLGSQDSRTFGPISTETVVGRAFLRVWPISDINQL